MVELTRPGFDTRELQEQWSARERVAETRALVKAQGSGKTNPPASRACGECGWCLAGIGCLSRGK